MIYLVEKLWTDPMENETSAAYGYAPHSYIETTEDVKRFAQSIGLVPKNKCWAFMGPMPEYRVIEIPKLSQADAKSGNSTQKGK